MKYEETFLYHKMRKISVKLILCVLILCYPVDSTRASEVSLRMKGLGKDLAGFVSDPETDILRNPARLSEMSRSEVLTVFEPRSYKSKTGEIRNPTLALKGFFPDLISSKFGFGFFSEGSEETSPYGFLSKRKDVNRYDPTIVEDEVMSTNLQESRRLVIEPFLSWAPKPRVRFGFSYDYGKGIKNQEGIRESSRIAIDLFTNDTLDLSNSNSEIESGNNLTTHNFKLGMAWDLGEMNFLEILGNLKLIKDDSSDYHVNELTRTSDREWTDIFSDSSYRYTIESGNFSREVEEDRPLLLDGKEVELGLKFSRKITEETTLRLLGNLTRGIGDLSGNHMELSDIKNEDYYFTYTFADTETTYTYTNAETLYSFSENASIVTGDWDFLSASLGFGLEKRLSNRILLGIALKGSYGQNVIKQKENIILTFQSDTTASETTTVVLTDEIDEKITRNRGNIVLPLGVELTLHPNVSLRFGVSPKVDFEEEKTEISGSLSQSSVEREVNFDYSLGLGYHITKNLFLDVFTESGLSTITSWEVGALYRL
jgi:hypothetical protein